MVDPVEFLKGSHMRAEMAVDVLPDGPWQWQGHDGPEGRYMALEGPAEVPVLRSRTHDDQVPSRLEWRPEFDWLLPDPAMVLRRVESERAILERHERFEQPGRVVCRDGNIIHDLYPCPTLLGLARAWGWDDSEWGRG